MFSSLTAFSQTKHCLRASGTVGMNSLFYSIDGGSSKPKLGFGGKFNYTYYFTPNWGIMTGVEASMYSTDGYLDGAYISIDDQIDDEGDVYRKDIYFRDWHENEKILFAEIPVMLTYQYDFGLRKRRKIYIDLGVKVQVPLIANYKVTSGELEIQGYYERWNVTLFGLPNHGFGTQGAKNTAGKLNIPFNISATLGIGFSFEVSKMVDIFIGGTFDYGFMNMKTTDNGDLLCMDANQNLQYNGILNSSAIEKANTVSVQGEVGVRIAVGKQGPGGIYGYRHK